VVIVKSALLAIAVFAADQFTKNWAEKNIPPGGEVEVIKNKVYLTNIRNKGAAYGVLSKHPKTLMAVTVFSAARFAETAFKFAKKYRTNKAFSFSLSCIIGGGAGNIYSRIRKGYVTDFLQVEHQKLSTAFNAADAAVIIGVAAFVGNLFFMEKKQS
jgi:signal peptidase II